MCSKVVLFGGRSGGCQSEGVVAVSLETVDLGAVNREEVDWKGGATAAETQFMGHIVIVGM
jgi:hypothetical protein